MRNHLIQNTESQKNLTLVLLKFGYDTDLGLVHIHNNALTKIRLRCLLITTSSTLCKWLFKANNNDTRAKCMAALIVFFVGFK